MQSNEYNYGSPCEEDRDWSGWETDSETGDDGKEGNKILFNFLLDFTPSIYFQLQTSRSNQHQTKNNANQRSKGRKRYQNQT